MGGTPRRMRPRKATLPPGLVLGWPRPRKVATGEEPGTTSPASAILSRLPLHACKYGARGDGAFWSATVLIVAACARPATVAAARERSGGDLSPHRGTAPTATPAWRSLSSKFRARAPRVVSTTPPPSTES